MIAAATKPETEIATARAVDLSPSAAKTRPLPEETDGFPEHRFFFRSFMGGLPPFERYLCLMPKRIELVQMAFDGLGSPVALFRNTEAE